MKKFILFTLAVLVISPIAVPLFFYLMSHFFYIIGDLLDIYVNFLNRYFIEDTVFILVYLSFAPFIAVILAAILITFGPRLDD